MEKRELEVGGGNFIPCLPKGELQNQTTKSRKMKSDYEACLQMGEREREKETRR